MNSLRNQQKANAQTEVCCGRVEKRKEGDKQMKPAGKDEPFFPTDLIVEV